MGSTPIFKQTQLIFSVAASLCIPLFVALSPYARDFTLVPVLLCISHGPLFIDLRNYAITVVPFNILKMARLKRPLFVNLIPIA